MALKTSLEKREHSTFWSRNKPEFSTGKDVAFEIRSTPERALPSQWASRRGGFCQLHWCFVFLTQITQFLPIPALSGHHFWNILFPTYRCTQGKSTKLSRSIFRAWGQQENNISCQHQPCEFVPEASIYVPHTCTFALVPPCTKPSKSSPVLQWQQLQIPIHNTLSLKLKGGL